MNKKELIGENIQYDNNQKIILNIVYDRILLELKIIKFRKIKSRIYYPTFY